MTIILHLFFSNIVLCFPLIFSFFEIRIQAIDGGFFEKFGSLLTQKSEIAEDQIISAHALQSENIVTDSVSLRTIEEGENDSGTETLHDTDSEPEDQQSKQEELIKECTGLNVSEYNHDNFFGGQKLKQKKKLKENENVLMLFCNKPCCADM